MTMAMERSIKGMSNEWLTPAYIIQNLGPFDLDPCAHPTHFTAKKRFVLPVDGLSQKWNGNVWLNPPYGPETQRWLKKLADHGNGIALVFARTDTKWFRDASAVCSGMKFLTGRIRFIPADGQNESNPAAPSLLIAYGKENAARLKHDYLDMPGVYMERR